MASNNNLDQYHSVLDETFKRKTDSARLVVYGLPAKVSKEVVEHNFFLDMTFKHYSSYTFQINSYQQQHLLTLISIRLVMLLYF